MGNISYLLLSSKSLSGIQILDFFLFIRIIYFDWHVSASEQPKVSESWEKLSENN